VAIGAFAMKHRSSITAAQQLFDDTTSALLTNFRHKKFLRQQLFRSFPW